MFWLSSIKKIKQQSTKLNIEKKTFFFRTVIKIAKSHKTAFDPNAYTNFDLALINY